MLSSNKELSDGDSEESFINGELFHYMRKTYKGIQDVEGKKIEKLKKCLLEGANINAADKNNHSNTVLHIAIKHNCIGIVKYLLTLKEIKTDIENDRGKTALVLAQDLKHDEIVNVLENHFYSFKFEELTVDKNCNFKTLKIVYASDKYCFWNNLSNYSDVDILKIDCHQQNPVFLQQLPFYQAVNKARNLFFVDVIMSESYAFDDEFLKSCLKSVKWPFIFQCGSSDNTSIYFKNSDSDISIIDLSSCIDSFDEDKLAEKISINGFEIDVMVDALKINLLGAFNGKRKSLLEVTYKLDVVVNGYKLIDYAVKYGNLLTIKLLSMNLCKLEQSTLKITAEFGNEDKIAALLNFQIPVPNECCFCKKFNYMHWNNTFPIAVKAGNRSIVRFLLKFRVKLQESWMDLACDNNRVGIVVDMLKADSVFPYKFQQILDYFDKNDAELSNLKSFVEERDNLHTLIEKNDLEGAKSLIQIITPSKFYLNKENDSAVYKALKFNNLKIYVWLMSEMECEFLNDREKRSLNKGTLHSVRDALLPSFAPIENAHILYLVAKSQSAKPRANFKQEIEQIYLKLNEIQEMSMVLKVIQFCDNLVIIYDFNAGSTTDVDPSTDTNVKGLCDYKSGRIYIGAKEKSDELLGTIAHEITHLAMHIVFSNHGNPYKARDINKKDKLHKILEEMNKKPKYMLDTIIKNAFISSYGKDEHHSELIVRVNHMLGKYGSEVGMTKLKEQVPLLLEYYKKLVEPSFQKLVEESHLIKQRSSVVLLNEYSGRIRDLENMKINFEPTFKLSDFIRNEQKQILILSCSSTWLSLINIYQNLKANCYNENSFLVFKFEHYFSRKADINCTFFTDVCELLVLECPNALEDDKLDVLIKLVDLLKQKPRKKIIYVMERSFVNGISGRLEELLEGATWNLDADSDFTLNSLKPETQALFLNSTIFLQNRCMPLSCIIDSDSYHLVDSEILTKLVNNEDVKIGKEPNIPSSYDEDYYVGRKFNHEARIKASFLQDWECQDVFAISDASDYIVKMLVNKKESVCCFNDGITDMHRFIVLDSKAAANQFQQLCLMFQLRTIHWVEVDIGDLIWQKLYLSNSTQVPQFLLENVQNLEIKSCISKYFDNLCNDTAVTNRFITSSALMRYIKDMCNNETGEKHSESSEYDVTKFNLDISTDESDLIALSNVDETAIAKLFPNQNCSLFYFGEDLQNKLNLKYVILDVHQEDREFEKLCEMFPLRNIYLVKREISHLIWRSTRGRFGKMRNYIDNSFAQMYSETDFVDNIDHFKSIIVPDTAGMGKTTILTKIIKSMNARYPDMWVIRIDLNDYTCILDKSNANVDLQTFLVTTFLDSRAESKLETSFEKNLLLYLLNNKDNKVVIMFDGFDEIKHTHQIIITKIMLDLRGTRIKQLWVTTRPFLRDELEDYFHLLSYTLQPFSELDQITFLTKFWRKKINLINESRLIIFAETLIKCLSQSISDKERTFTGIPLQTRMLAESFVNECEEFCKNDVAQPSIPERIDLIDLYRLFLQNKYNIYQYDKNTMPASKPQVERQIEQWYQIYLKNHQMAALFTIFEELELNKLVMKSDRDCGKTFIKDIEDGKENSGIIDRIVAGKPHFVHLTFAEYFSGEFIVGLLERINRNVKLQNFLLNEVLCKPKFGVIRAFIDSLLAKKDMPETSLKNYGQQIKSLWSEKGGNLKSDSQNLLHIAAKEGNMQITKFLYCSIMSSAEGGDATWNSLLNNRDNKVMQAIHYCARNGHLSVLEFLVDTGADVNASVPGTKTQIASNVIYLAASGNHIHVCDWLFSQSKFDIDAKVSGHKKFNGMNALHLAAEQDNLDVVKLLIKYGASPHIIVEGNNNYKEINAMQLAVIRGSCRVYNWLVMEKIVDIKSPDLSSLAAGIATQGLEQFRLLLQFGLDINGVDGENNRTALHTAVYAGDIPLIEFLIANGAKGYFADDKSYTPLHIAAHRDYTSVAKLLLEHKVSLEINVNARNEDQQTALFIAIWRNNTAIIAMLIENGADVNAVDDWGWTPMHQAERYNHIESAKLLLAHGACQSILDNRGKSPLDISTKRSNT